MDWDKWAQDMFTTCVAEIQETNPIDSPLEWTLLWEMMLHWKTYKENKCRNLVNKTKVSTASESHSAPEEPDQRGKES
jgi:hypothetical protein